MYRWLAAALLFVAIPLTGKAADPAPNLEHQLAAAPALPGAGLFETLPASATEAPADTSPDVIRSRTVAVSPAYLQSLLGARAAEVDAAGNLSNVPDRATLNLFDDLSVDMVKLQLSRGPLGQQILRGSLVDGGEVTLAIMDGAVTAQISTGGHQVTVQPLPGGGHRITEFTRRQLRDDTLPSDPVPPGATPPPSTGAEKPAAGASQLRILVVYTPSALARVGSLATLRADIGLMIDNLNLTLANSQVSATATLAGLEQVNYTEATGAVGADVLNDATANVGDFARIQKVRYAVNADIVSIMSGYDDPTSCGYGAVNDNFDQVSNLTPYVGRGVNTVSLTGGCLTQSVSTFTHEVGHNLGASHDRYVLTNPLPGPQFYAAGYVDLVGKFRDTMAYDTQCEDNNVDCPRVSYYSNPNLTYNGRPLGIADNLPAAADASRRIREITPYVAQLKSLLTAPSQPVLAVLVSGAGTVTSDVGGLNCGTTCAASLTSGQQVTLTPSAPAGWSFKQWDGACTGTGTSSGACTVAMTASKNVTATFTPTLRFGPVFSSAQVSSQSFIRLANTGSTSGTAVVKLWDYTTGAALGQWTSPAIPAGTAPQFGISTIESALTGAKPQYYAVAVQTDMSGSAQHVLWKPSDGTLTNLSTCDTGISGGAGQVANVHTSVLNNGYPSSVAINNTSAGSATGVSLGVYDARNGTKLGSYAVATIPANSKVIVAVSDIEAGAHITPTSDMFHYVIKPEGTFTGFLQHLVNNQAVGVITDMTTVCAFGIAPSPLLTVAFVQPGPLYSSAQSTSQSFLRFTNTGTTAGTVAVTLRNATTGARLGQWISAAIAPGAAPQYAITDLESAIGVGQKPQYYSAQIETQMTGSVAHVLWKPADGTLTNLSTCDAGISSNTGLIANVHTSRLDTGYPSTVAVNNTGAAAQAFTLGVFDARNGTRLGTYTTAQIPANGQVLLAVAAIEFVLGIKPTADMFHYVIKMEGASTGFLQHLVNNQTAAVITDMTTVCQLPAAKAVSYTDCAPNVTPRCSATLGLATAGQIKQANSWQNYDVHLTAGVPYTIQVKGSSTGNGSLQQPYVFVLSGNSTAAQGGGGGTGTDAKLTFTPTTTATYTIQVTTYVYADSAGTFVLTIQ